MSGSPRIRRLFTNLLDRWQPSTWYVLGTAAIIVGLAGGVGVWLFKEMYYWIGHYFDAIYQDWVWLGAWIMIPMMAAVGLLVGLISHYLVGEERHHGVAGIIESVALAGGRLRYWRLPLKSLAAALSLGGGASVGPEDPSVQIGSNIGSMVGQWLHLSDERVRILVAAGAASGIAAAFNAPIAGVFFAIEIVLGEISGNAMGVVLLASVVSAVVTQIVSGPQPAFIVPTYPYHSALELPFFLGLGLLTGLLAVAYIRLIYRMNDFFHSLPVPPWFRPAIAGAMVASVAIFLPQVRGVGYDTIESALNNVNVGVLLFLFISLAKLVLTPVSVGGGFPGGVFAPVLVIGATFGNAYGQIVNDFVPALNLVPASFAMVGMAATLAGAIHAPLTAMLLLFEMTNDYRIILPLMFAVTVSMLVSQRLQRDSVYGLALARKGIRIERGRDVEVLEGLTVGEVMDTHTATFREDTMLDDAAAQLMESRSHGLPVVDDAGRLVGILTIQDIERAQASSPDPHTLRVGDACTRQLLVAYDDESMGDALRRMSTRDIGRLPVVARDDPHRLLGVLRRTNIIRAYDIALTRRAMLRHRANQVRLGEIGRVQIEEFVIEESSPCAGKQVSQIAWPHDSVIATLRRGRQLVIPRGDTVLQPGDVLAVVAEGDALATVRHYCLAPENAAREKQHDRT